MKEETDLIVQLAEYVEEENWESVFELLLDLTKESYKNGYYDGYQLTKRLYDNRNNL